MLLGMDIGELVGIELSNIVYLLVLLVFLWLGDGMMGCRDSMFFYEGIRL